jgi:hypothetical protein
VTGGILESHHGEVSEPLLDSLGQRRRAAVLTFADALVARGVLSLEERRTAAAILSARLPLSYLPRSEWDKVTGAMQRFTQLDRSAIEVEQLLIDEDFWISLLARDLLREILSPPEPYQAIAEAEAVVRRLGGEPRPGPPPGPGHHGVSLTFWSVKITSAQHGLSEALLHFGDASREAKRRQEERASRLTQAEEGQTWYAATTVEHGSYRPSRGGPIPTPPQISVGLAEPRMLQALAVEAARLVSGAGLVEVTNPDTGEVSRGVPRKEAEKVVRAFYGVVMERLASTGCPAPPLTFSEEGEASGTFDPETWTITAKLRAGDDLSAEGDELAPPDERLLADDEPEPALEDDPLGEAPPPPPTMVQVPQPDWMVPPEYITESDLILSLIAVLHELRHTEQIFEKGCWEVAHREIPEAVPPDVIEAMKVRVGRGYDPAAPENAWAGWLASAPAVQTSDAAINARVEAAMKGLVEVQRRWRAYLRDPAHGLATPTEEQLRQRHTELYEELTHAHRECVEALSAYQRLPAEWDSFLLQGRFEALLGAVQFHHADHTLSSLRLPLYRPRVGGGLEEVAAPRGSRSRRVEWTLKVAPSKGLQYRMEPRPRPALDAESGGFRHPDGVKAVQPRTPKKQRPTTAQRAVPPQETQSHTGKPQVKPPGT